ncbi:MAG: TerB family tellurite resistance protein [Proteobacteria bacterium]|nr:TerB family tellurite resistance protein [Pseudomonadota bacterium]
MAGEILCRQCGKRPVTTVRNVWYIEGVLFASRRGTKVFVGCDECARAEVMACLRQHGTTGWLSVPWGLGTPFVVVQNLYEVFRANNEEQLRLLIRKRGLRPEDIEPGGGAIAAEKLGHAVVATLHDMIWADGDVDEREVDLAVTIVGQMLGDTLHAEWVRRKLKSEEFSGLRDIFGLDLESRVILFRAAADIAMVDGVFHEGEESQLRILGTRLDLPDSLVDRLIVALRTQLDNGPAREDAALLLRVKIDAPMIEVKRSYMELKLNASGTQEDIEAYQQALQEAYETLIGAAPPT